MDELRKLIEQDIREREVIKEGLKRVKNRQTILICVGILIFVMFAFNFIQVKKQINMMNDVAAVANALIKAQDAEQDSLIEVNAILVADSVQNSKHKIKTR